MKNIAYLQNSGQIGGGNRSMLALWQGLKQFPLRPVIFSPGEGPMADLVREMGLPLHIVREACSRWRPARTLQCGWRWGSLLRGEGISLIHANDPHVARSVMFSAAVLKVPVLVHVRFPQSEQYYRWVFRRMPKPDGFVFNSHQIQQQVGGLLREACPRTPQWVVHNAVDLASFQPRMHKKKGRLRVGIIANLNPIKGHEDFIDMAERVVACRADVVFDVIGADIDGTSRLEELVNLAMEKNLLGAVTFHGHVQDVHRIMTELDVVVSTSRMETFGRTLIEAMACGKPVVSYRVGGIPEIVVEGGTGHMVPLGDVGQLVERVNELLEKPSMRDDMGREGRRRAEECFGITAHTEAILSIYRTLLGKGTD